MKLMRASTLLLVLITGAALQADDKQDKKALPGLQKLKPEQLIKLWDKNKNGSVEREELPAPAQVLFERLDTNADGKLNASELSRLLELAKQRRGNQDAKVGKGKAGAKKGGADTDREINQLFRRLDANQDGKLARSEVAGRPLAKAFDALDRNKDGYLERSELNTWVQRAARAGVGRGRGAVQNPLRNNSDDFDALDADADGRLTREELQGTKWATLFEKLDGNQDRKIERKEFENYLKQAAEAAGAATKTDKPPSK
jgi:Ca2+-binding EF-hand superfamily protein